MRRVREHPCTIGDFDEVVLTEVEDDVLIDWPRDGYTRFVCVSDTHTLTHKLALPPGDVLLHCGDFSRTGARDEVLAFVQWLERQPHAHKIVIAGNHETTFEDEFYAKKWKGYHRVKEDAQEVQNFVKDNDNFIYLQDSSCVVNGLTIYGSPWQPEFCDWAFNLPTGCEELKEKWDAIPNDVHILMTHSPPDGHGDATETGDRKGCADLMEAVRRTRPLFHVFGHIHTGYGATTEDGVDTVFVNAATCNEEYKPINPPMVFDVENTREND